VIFLNKIFCLYSDKTVDLFCCADKEKILAYLMQLIKKSEPWLHGIKQNLQGSLLLVGPEQEKESMLVSEG
jgi:hypothetical protein